MSEVVLYTIMCTRRVHLLCVLKIQTYALSLILSRLRDSSPVRGRMGGAALRGSSEDLLAMRRKEYRSSHLCKRFSPVSLQHKNLLYTKISLYVQGSADEDSDRSLQDLTSLNHSGDLQFARKKLSSRLVYTSTLTLLTSPFV